MSEGDPIYMVVVNDEEQYSIWPQQKELPPGWREAGMAGTKDDCLAYVDQVWTDMRPRSLREAMAAAPAPHDVT
jgi:MbtH protein